MRAERAAGLVAAWVRIYTADLPAAVAARRREELAADLHDQIAWERDAGNADGRLALGLLSRTVRGMPADAAWRGRQVRATVDRGATRRELTGTRRRAYRAAVAVALGTALMLLWLMGAVGVIGVEGDGWDRIYLGVLAIGLAGAAAARLRPYGMARALLATALAVGVVGVVALLAGKHQAAGSSVYEIVGLTGFLAAPFAGSAWLFRQAARRSLR